jgi:hypothetical protein
MTKSKSKANATSNAKISKTIVVLGVDLDGNTRAGRFQGSQGELVAKAAASLGLRTFELETASLDPLLVKLQQGRLYSNGQGFVPAVRKDRMPKLWKAVGATDTGELRMPIPAVQHSGLPADWTSITKGHLVIALEDDPQDGWWEAVVIDVNGDMLTLRFRYFPKQSPVQRHRSAVALLSPATNS